MTLCSRELQSRFIRSLENEYDRRVAEYLAVGMGAEESQCSALDDIKDLGRQVLEELRLRGLFPWESSDPPVAASSATTKQEQRPSSPKGRS